MKSILTLQCKGCNYIFVMPGLSKKELVKGWNNLVSLYSTSVVNDRKGLFELAMSYGRKHDLYNEKYLLLNQNGKPYINSVNSIWNVVGSKHEGVNLFKLNTDMRYHSWCEILIPILGIPALLYVLKLIAGFI